jgi:hypothetical protein
MTKLYISETNTAQKKEKSLRNKEDTLEQIMKNNMSKQKKKEKDLEENIKSV